MNLLTKKEVCDKLQVSGDTVDKLHELGLLPRIQVTARTIRYKIEDLKRLIDRRLLS